MDLFKFQQYISDRKSFLVYGQWKDRRFVTEITWIEGMELYQVSIGKMVCCEDSEEILGLYWNGYLLENYIKAGRPLLCGRDSKVERSMVRKYIRSEYREKCFYKLEYSKKSFGETIISAPRILNTNNMKCLSEEEFKECARRYACLEQQGYMITSDGWDGDSFYIGEMKSLTEYMVNYLDYHDFSMAFCKEGGILQYMTSDDRRIERDYYLLSRINI